MYRNVQLKNNFIKVLTRLRPISILTDYEANRPDHRLDNYQLGSHPDLLRVLQSPSGADRNCRTRLYRTLIRLNET